MIIIIGILIISIVAIYLFRIWQKRPSQFWDKQPVWGDFEGQIIASPSLEIMETDTIIENLSLQCREIDFATDLDNLKSFWMTHYRNDEIYTDNYLRYLFESPSANVRGFSLISNTFLSKKVKPKIYPDTGELIATITAREIHLCIGDNAMRGYCVDFLCIHPEYRSRGLAPILISKILELWKASAFNLNIFKKDITPLAFPHLSDSDGLTYYRISVESIEINKLAKSNNRILPLSSDLNSNSNSDMMVESNRYFFDQIEKYAIRELITEDEFKYRFTTRPGMIYTYITIDAEDAVTGFIQFIISDYQKDGVGEYITTAEITYLFGVRELDGYVAQLTKDMRDNNQTKKISYIIFLDIMDKLWLHHKYPTIANYKTYYHLYNYVAKIDKKDIGIVL